MSYKEDYNKAVFLNAYGNGKPIKNNNEYQRYFEFECEITNPRKYHKNLIKAGYLEPSSPKDVISSLKVSELKEICDSVGVTKTGKKQDLINKIILSCSTEQIYSFVSEQLYSLSEKGASYVLEHEDYVNLHNHKNWCIELDEYVNFKQTLPFYGSFRDVAWGIFNKRIIEYSKQYGMLRNNYLYMSDFMKEERNYREQLKYLLYVLFYDIYDMIDEQNIKYCDTKDEALERYDCFALKTHIPKAIAALKEYYNGTYIDEIYTQYKRLALKLCDKYTFKLLISDIMDDKGNGQEKSEAILYNIYTKHIDEYFIKHPVSKRQKYYEWIDFLEKGGTSEEWEQLHSKKFSTNTKKTGGCLTSVMICCLFIFSIMSFLILL